MGKKNTTITSFFKRKNDEQIDNDVETQKLKRQKASTSQPTNETASEAVNEPASEAVNEPVSEAVNEPVVNEPVSVGVNRQVNELGQGKQQEGDEIDINSLERDPAKRKKMWDYPVDTREKVRLAYISLGAYQVELKEYKSRGPKNKPRRFIKAWYNIFPNWLEYSPTSHKAYCFICFLYLDKANGRKGHNAFTDEGFDNWKKVNDTSRCPLIKHVQSEKHKKAFEFYKNLLNQEAHIENFVSKLTDEQIRKNRLRLRTTIDVVLWLTYQACALRGHDESSTSMNEGNFRELLKLLAYYNEDIAQVILGNAPFNSKYTSPDIQHEILSIVANKVRKHIRDEVGDSWYCVMVDESRDESKKEQMAIVLRFVDAKGMIQERFLDLVHVHDTLAMTLKENLFNTLLRHGFDVSKIRGQGYDGASNMRGQWNGLQTLVRQSTPYAYYVHCFAHRLQLALVWVSRNVIPVHEFFKHLGEVVNAATGSSKRNDELNRAKADDIKRLLQMGEVKSGKGKNQVGTLKRAGDTRWGSHFKSVCSLIDMFDATREVFKGIMDDMDHTNLNQRGDAGIAYKYLKSFEFVFILHMMKEVMGKTDTLCEALQRKSQDILNAMQCVSATKVGLNNFRNNGWDSFFNKVNYFCERHNIEMPDMSAPFTSTQYRPRKKDLHVTFEHYYRVDLFTTVLDQQLQELDSRFDEQAVELLSLSATLCSKNIDVDQILLLVEKYYPTDFTEYEKIQLRYQLETFQVERINDTKLSEASTLSDLCKALVETQKNDMYGLVERVYRLILTLPVSTATTERGFSAMKIIKNRLRNRMSDAYLANSLVIYIEKEIARGFDTDSIIEDFKNLKGRRAEL